MIGGALVMLVDCGAHRLDKVIEIEIFHLSILRIARVILFLQPENEL